MNSPNQKRRIFLKGVLATTAVSSAIGTGLAYTYPTTKTTWPKAAFNANSIKKALLKLTGDNTITPNPGGILIKAPAIAENGIAHITIQSNIERTESITILIPNNALPLVANFKLDPSVTNTITTRIKIKNSGDIMAVIKADNKLYSATKKMRLTTAK